MSKNNMLSLALIQAKVDKEASINLERSLASMALCAKKGAQIICTQELFLTPYFCQEEKAQNFAFAESIPGPSTDALCKCARELEVVIVASLFERRMPGLYHNTVVVIDADGTLLGLYRKMHIPDDPDYYEKYYFRPGDLGYKVWKTRYASIGTLLCWDQWFPEAARITALMGADILFYPTAIGWQEHEYESLGKKQHEAWETIQRSHSIANGIYVCAANRVGQEGNINFWGQSFVCDPMGEVLARASSEKEENLLCSIDLSEIEKTRVDWPFLRDRRTDSYQNLLNAGPLPEKKEEAGKNTS